MRMSHISHNSRGLLQARNGWDTALIQDRSAAPARVRPRPTKSTRPDHAIA